MLHAFIFSAVAARPTKSRRRGPCEMKKGAAHLPPPSLQVASPQACFGSKLLATGDLMVLTRVGLVKDVNTQILFRLSPPLHPSDQGQLLRIADMLCRAFTLLCFTSPETASQVMSLWRVSSTCADTTPLAATAAQSPGAPSTSAQFVSATTLSGRRRLPCFIPTGLGL